MPRRRRPNIGCRIPSNGGRGSLRANRTDDQRNTDNTRIGKAELYSKLTEKEADRLRMQ